MRALDPSRARNVRWTPSGLPAAFCTNGNQRGQSAAFGMGRVNAEFGAQTTWRVLATRDQSDSDRPGCLRPVSEPRHSTSARSKLARPASSSVGIHPRNSDRPPRCSRYRCGQLRAITAIGAIQLGPAAPSGAYREGRTAVIATRATAAPGSRVASDQGEPRHRWRGSPCGFPQGCRAPC